MKEEVWIADMENLELKDRVPTLYSAINVALIKIEQKDRKERKKRKEHVE